MSYSNVPHAIPLRSDCKNGPILVILLGDLFADQAKKEEICRVIDARSRFALTGANNMWPTCVPVPHAEQDLFGNSGTVTDLYNVAAAAKACGWEALMFVDELSWRQYKGTVTNREDPTLSATVVNLVCAPSKTVLSAKSTFFVRRLPLVMAMEESYLAEPQTPKDWSRLDSRVNNHGFQLHLRTGFYLYCPWEPILSHDDLAEISSQALCARPILPPEIKGQIMDYLHPEEPSCLQELIDTTGINEQSAGLIQPLVPLSKDEVSIINQAFKDVIPIHHFQMGSWKQKSFANRREVSRILRHFERHTHEIILILNRPSDEQDLQLAVYAPSSQSFEGCRFGTFHKMTLESFKDQYRGRIPYVLDQCTTAQWDKSKEVYIDPRRSFPPSLPYWYKTLPLTEVSQSRDRGYSEPDHMQHNKYLVFYLTKHLTNDEQNLIRQVVEADNASGTGYDYIPWLNDVDGGPEDMLRLLKMVGTSANLGFRTEQDYLLLFVDRQSAIDHKVIACTWSYIQDHGNSGIIYGRLGFDFELFLVNVPGNESIEDWIPEDELQFFRDPDYSGPREDDQEQDMND